MNYHVRAVVVALRELYRQDIVEAFWQLKAHIHDDKAAAKMAPLPTPLQELLANSSVVEDLRRVDHMEELPWAVWHLFRKALARHHPDSYRIRWEKATTRLKTGAASRLSTWSYERGWPLLGIYGLRVMDTRERVVLAKKMEPEDVHEFYYLLAKGFAYREMEPGLLIKGSTSVAGITSYFEVYKKIVTGKGMVAYALRRAEASMRHIQPLIVLRGTSTAPAGLDSMAAVLTDIEPVLGKTAWETGKARLFSLLQDPLFITKADHTLTVIGHSLGGTLTQFFVSAIAAEESRMPAEIKKLSFHLFNSTAVAKTAALRFAAHMGEKGRLIYEGRVFKAAGDPANFVGEYFLGKDCPEEGRSHVTYQHVRASSKDPHCDLLHLVDPQNHLALHEIQETRDQKLLNTLLDNTTEPEHQILEFIRLYIARPLIYLLIWPLYQLYIGLVGNRSVRVKEAIDADYNDSFSKWFYKHTKPL